MCCLFGWTEHVNRWGPANVHFSGIWQLSGRCTHKHTLFIFIHCSSFDGWKIPQNLTEPMQAKMRKLHSQKGPVLQDYFLCKYNTYIWFCNVFHYYHFYFRNLNMLLLVFVLNTQIWLMFVLFFILRTMDLCLTVCWSRTPTDAVMDAHVQVYVLTQWYWKLNHFVTDKGDTFHFWLVTVLQGIHVFFYCLGNLTCPLFFPLFDLRLEKC